MTTHRTESDEEMELQLQRQRGDRRHLSLAQVAIIIGLSGNFGVLVWGAATINASVDTLSRTVALLTVQLEKTQNSVGELKIDVGVLKDRANNK